MTMEIVFKDGFDWLPASATATAIVTKWSGSVTSAARAAGRHSDTQPSYSCGAINLRHTITGTRDIIWMGAVLTQAANTDIIAFEGPSGTLQVYLEWRNALGEFVLWRGPIGSPTTLATTAINGAVGQWYHLQLGVRFDNSAGAAVLRVNNAQVLAVSGVDTQADSTNTCTGIRHGDSGGVGASGLFTDDVHVLAGTFDTTIADDFLGDVFIQTVWPAADSTIHLDWTPSTGSNYYSLIDDAESGGGPDTSDYITTDTVGARYGVFMENIDTTVIDEIVSVQWNQLAKYNESGPDYIRSMLYISGTDYTGSTAHLLNSTYFTWRDIYTTSPDTGSAWTPAEILATEWGAAKE